VTKNDDDDDDDNNNNNNNNSNSQTGAKSASFTTKYFPNFRIVLTHTPLRLQLCPSKFCAQLSYRSIITVPLGSKYASPALVLSTCGQRLKILGSRLTLATSPFDLYLVERGNARKVMKTN
jgi:hypothetical protein